MVVAQQVTIGPLQGGVSNNGAPSGSFLLADPIGNATQPRPAVLVSQRDTVPHLRDVRLPVQVITLGEVEAGATRDLLPERGLAAATHPSDHESHRLRLRHDL